VNPETAADAAARRWRALSVRSAGLALVALALLVNLVARCAGPRRAAAPPEPAAGPTAASDALAPERESVVPDRAAAAKEPFALAAEPAVRVALAAARGVSKVRLSTAGPCEIAVGGGAPVRRPRLEKFDVTAGAAGLRAPGVRNDVASILVRAEGGVGVGGAAYRGEVLLEWRPGGKLDAINSVSMEDYLRGVVPGEMPRAFPAAALEAQAIVARTYALASVSGLRSGSPLVLTDDVSDQVYSGVKAETAETDAAVRRTAGLVVTFDGNPIVAYFHSTCGGHTSDPGPVLARATSPPLRGVRCGACADSPHFRWTAEIARDDVRRALVACGAAEGSVAAFSIAPGTRDEGGRLLEFRATSGRDGSAIGVDANSLRLAVGSRMLKSTRVDSIESRGGSLLFQGGGFGHGCGLCQYGARGLAASGRDARGILAHYFPGAAVSRVYPARADATARR